MTTRGKRSTGRDEADGIAAEVDMIAWEDGTYTVAEVRLEGTPRRSELAEKVRQLALLSRGYRPIDDDGLNTARLSTLCDVIDELAAILDLEAEA